MLIETTEKEKMLSGELYDAFDTDLLCERIRARGLVRQLNNTTGEPRELREAILRELFGEIGDHVWVEPPFHCDYGKNIVVERGVYINFDCVFLDCNRIQIGEGSLIGPAVQIYTASHPTDPELRKTGRELALPVRIGRNVWIGGGAIVCPGVTIGDNSTIGAGSVVTRDVPANVVAAGNPCRLIREC